MLDNAGAHVKVVTNPQDAWMQIEILRRSSTEDWALLLDIPANPLDSLELLQECGAEHLQGIPVLALLPSSGLQGNSFAFPHTLTKPATESELLNAILECSGQQEAEASQMESDGNKPATRSFHVLLADDGIINQEVASALLELLGHTFELANTGKEAIEAFKRTSFDVIFMDLEMPVIDGLDATKLIRNIEQSRGTHVPIVAMTAHAINGFREKCLSAGMDDFVTKPIRPDALEKIFAGLAAKDEEAAIPLDERGTVPLTACTTLPIPGGLTCTTDTKALN